MIMCALAIALNIVLGTVVQKLQIPLLFLDTIGTIFAAVLFGPWYGALVGIIVGYMVRRFKFSAVTAVITGIILSIVCSVIGTPIAVFVYGGITGNIIDKIGSCILVFAVMKYIPSQYGDSSNISA